jgi:hypothetical protein
MSIALTIIEAVEKLEKLSVIMDTERKKELNKFCHLNYQSVTTTKIYEQK